MVLGSLGDDTARSGRRITRWPSLAAVVLIGCGGAVLAADGGAPGAGAPACEDDRPPAGAKFVEGGQPCTLADGGMGVGGGGYGCIDPTACNCLPQAVPAQCVSGHCIYASCGEVGNDAECRLPDGGTGWCCMETCQSGVNGGGDDPNNCGGCSYACPAEARCIGSGCEPDCTKQPCPAQRVCVGTWCVFPDCAGQPDGAPCALQKKTSPLSGSIGTCCSGTCVDPTYDDTNCGRCGARCCPGTHCSGNECL